MITDLTFEENFKTDFPKIHKIIKANFDGFALGFEHAKNTGEKKTAKKMQRNFSKIDDEFKKLIFKIYGDEYF